MIETSEPELEFWTDGLELELRLSDLSKGSMNLCCINLDN